MFTIGTSADIPPPAIPTKEAASGPAERQAHNVATTTDAVAVASRHVETDNPVCRHAGAGHERSEERRLGWIQVPSFPLWR